MSRSYPPSWRRRFRAWRRRSSFAWWATAVALVLVTGAVVRAGVVRSTAVLDELGPMRDVLVVVRPVDIGHVVDEGDVTLARRPSATVPDGAVDDADDEDVVGRVALVPLVPGEVVLASKLAPDGLRGAAALLPEGLRALAVPAGPAGRPPVSLGDRVDVLATLVDGPTVVVAEGALVVALDEESDAVTVAVTPPEAADVASAITSGTITLALSGRGPAR